jgi:ATP-dependent DNA helicase RecG
VQHADGFTLAERDLELRGPGDLLGDAQSGFPELRFASITDMDLVRTAREAAKRILEADPELVGYPVLAKQVKEAVESAHVE